MPALLVYMPPCWGKPLRLVVPYTSTPNSKNVEFKIANIDCGVGILKLKKNWEYLKIPELSKLTFKDFYKDYFPKLPIVNSEEAFNFIDKI